MPNDKPKNTDTTDRPNRLKFDRRQVADARGRAFKRAKRPIRPAKS